MNRAVGLVVALASEAKALFGRGRWERGHGVTSRRVRLAHDVTLIIVRSGMGVDNARAASQWLIGQGVRTLGISGVSGGLDPGLGPGDLILADGVIDDTDNQLYAVSPAFVRTASAALEAMGVSAHRGPIVTVSRPVLSAGDKGALYARRKALAADMESAAAASVAHTSGLPFFVFRAVCDPACLSISCDLFGCLDQKARVRPFHLVKTLLVKPAFISELFHMRRSFHAALTGLGRAWRSGIRDTLSSSVL